MGKIFGTSFKMRKQLQNQITGPSVTMCRIAMDGNIPCEIHHIDSQPRDIE